MEWNAHWNSMEWNAHALECASVYVGVCGGKRCAENRETCCNNRRFHLGNDFNYQFINDHVSLDQWLSIVDPMPEARVRFSPSTETK